MFFNNLAEKLKIFLKTTKHTIIKTKKPPVFSQFEKHPHLSGLTSDELELLEKLVKIKNYAQGDIIFSEGDESDDLCFIITGKTGIEKYDHQKRLQHIGEAAAGDIVGEMAFLDPEKRSATVVAMAETQLATLNRDRLLENGEMGKNIYHNLIKRIASVCINHLRKTSHEYVETLLKKNEQLQTQTEFGRFFIAIIITFGISSLFDELIFSYSPQRIGSPLYNWGYLLVLLLPAIYLIKRFNYSLATFGVTFNNWKRSVTEGLGIAILLTVLFFSALFLYMLIIKTASIQINQWPPLALVLYFFQAYIQEFMARGMLQTSLQRFFNDQKGTLSISISSFLFAFLHMHKGLQASFIVFIFSLFLGWIYLRHKNLLGITIIHFFLGILGYQYGVVGK